MPTSDTSTALRADKHLAGFTASGLGSEAFRLAPAAPCASPSVNPNPSPVLDVIIGQADDAQPPLPLASDGVLRWVWQSRFGEMLIEVVGDEVLVNGQRVNRHAP
jgi:hypothetical protein